MVALTVLMAALILLFLWLPAFTWQTPAEPPAIIEIQLICHTDESILNYDSRVILRHNGTERIVNDDVRAVFYRNDLPVACNIETLNGYRFISTHHYGVQLMGGSGCSGLYWNPGEKTWIDFTDGTFHPGDQVQVDIIDKISDLVISRHHFPA